MRTTLAAFVVAVGLAIALAGCGGSPPMPVPTATVTPTPGATAPAEPQLDLTGSAAANQPYFDQVNIATVDAGGRGGRAFIDGLVAAGYPKAAMEVTPDRTSINAEADNYQFAIRLGGTCLIGQYGVAGYASTTGKLLADGRCLVGTTLPIDW